MKIFHIVEAWHGGIASYVQTLVQAQVDQGHQPILVADDALLCADQRTLPCPVETYPASRNPVRFKKIRSALGCLLQQHEPDIVHVHSTFPGVYTRFPTALHPHIVYTPHGWSFLKKDSSVAVRWAYGHIERLLAKQARAVMCMSFQELDRAVALGLPAARLWMIHTGIKDQPNAGMMGEAEATSRSAGLQIGFFGRLDYQKGADLLPGLASQLAPGAMLHLFGTEVRGRQFQADHPQIRKHGWVAHHDLAAHMAQMDVIVIPSRWEGFSLTALEALRAGVPIVVSDCTSLIEVVIHGYNGLIMREYSAGHLAQLVNGLTHAECHRMGVNARQVFQETYTFERYYRQVMDLYQHVLADSQG